MEAEGSNGPGPNGPRGSGVKLLAKYCSRGEAPRDVESLYFLTKQHQVGRICVWWNRGERTLAAYILYRHTGPSPGVMRVPAIAHQNVWFMHKGATAYFSIAMRKRLHSKYLWRWIERGRSVASSLNLNPLDFFFWCFFKSLGYETPVATMDKIVTLIVIASTDIASTPKLFKRSR
ncbi:hypothetical protein TNCV_2923211 [Trichonephila clavipes]|nr:hypothetical protein TNCV_2923211 [Trichonephila clavipes]